MSNILYLFITIISLFNFVDSYGGWIFDKSKQECGIIYTGINYTMSKLKIKNPYVINDLSILNIEDHTTQRVEGVRSFQRGLSKTWDKNISSIQLYEGCKINICSETYLEGKCIWFNTSRPIINKKWNDLGISSIGCSCPIKNCQKSRCSEIKLRSKDCGRAFLEPHCRICGGQYVMIKKNDEQPHFGGYEEKVKSLVINRGCKLTYYTGEYYSKDEYILEEGLHEQFDATLGSYHCTCEENLNMSKPIIKPIRMDSPNSNSTVFDFPSNIKDIQKLFELNPGHKGLEAALTSMRHKRSPRNAYILLIGLTGSGKSSTINFLFDNTTICGIGSDTSTTSSIHEYRIPVQVDELGCKNCELRVIDTPGFGDTSGLETDAKFLAGLDTYLQTHEELRYRIPNIILIVTKFTDNRIKGKSSNFVKTLRGIELFKEKLFDLKYSNAINVMTHYMSENRRLRVNPSPKIRVFSQLIQDYTTLPKPVTIVVAENKPDDHEMVMVNGYYLLPNGDYYPQNLFENIQYTTERGHDPIGEAIIRTAFKSLDNINITEKIFSLKNQTFTKELYFLGELHAGNFNIEQTEVSNITKNIYDEQIPFDMKREYPGTLEYVQRVLNLQNIFTKDKIPRTTVGILKLFKNIRQNKLVQLLLSKSFNLEIPSLDIPLITGQCYDILKDIVLPVSPFLTTTKHVSEIGFKLSSTTSSKLIMNVADVFYLYDTMEEYTRERLNLLQVQGKINTDLNWGTIRPGFNTLTIFNGNITENGRHSITALREYRLFQLTLNSNPEFNPEFIQRIKNIPYFDETNHTIVDDWKQFFIKYGTHVVNSAYGGGAIKIEFKMKNDSISSDDSRLILKKSYENFLKFLEDIYLGKHVNINFIGTEEHVKYSLNFIGGDFQYAVSDFSSLSIDQVTNLLEGFRESLEFQPTILQTSLSLIPLSVIVKKFDIKYSDKIYKATTSLLNANLTYIPPPPQPPPLERPEVQKHIEQLKADLQAHIDRLSKELKLSRETFEKFTQELIKQNDEEREVMRKQMEDAHRKTLESVFLNCVYEQANLTGDKICNAEQQTCVSIYMKTVRSVNTYNSCVQFFNGHGCTGTSYKHISNETYNTKFPFDLSQGGRFSVLNC